MKFNKKFLSWNIANTTTRRFKTRLLPSLQALQAFDIPYKKTNKEIQKLFAKYLEKNIESYNIGKREDYDDLARKSIACLKQFGLVFPNISRPKKLKWDLNEENQDIKLLELINTSQTKLKSKGRPWEITPLGNELLKAENDYFVEKVFQKIFILYRLPSLLDKQHKNNCDQFSPLKLIILTLKKVKYLTSSEFALFILMNLRDDNIIEITNKIKKFREDFLKKRGREKQFAADYFLSKKMGTEKNFESVLSYVDTAYQYFKLTGLFKQKGKKIILKENNSEIISQILRLIDKYKNISDIQYLTILWSGNIQIIPNQKSLDTSVSNLNEFFKKIKVEIPKSIKNKENTENKLIELRNFQDIKTEENYYLFQQKEWKKIYTLLEDIKKKWIFVGERQIKTAPEILEWVTWKSLLAINNITCRPGDTRFFDIDINDEDLLPLNDSKSGYEDLFFQFEKYNLVVEVTYTVSSRQDAAERVSVREHLVKRLNEKKDTYALFLAPSLDLNTLKAYSEAYWWKGEEYDDLKIIPLSIDQYKNIFFKIMSQNKKVKNLLLREIFDNCLVNRKIKPNMWLEHINKTISSFLN